MQASVARWFIFKPKIQIWVNFGGPLFGKCLHASWPFGIVYRNLRYLMTIRYILCSFGTFFPILVPLAIKNLATLLHAVEKKGKGRSTVPSRKNKSRS
jgi:hypothetical protein